jgi:hypothetical protein
MSDRTEQLLSEMLRWIRASSHGTIHETLKKEFLKNGKLDETKARVYQMSDGQATSVAIAKAAKSSQPHVSTLWKHWRQLGLAESSGESSRQTRRCFSLEDFGMNPDEKG